MGEVSKYRLYVDELKTEIVMLKEENGKLTTENAELKLNVTQKGRGNDALVKNTVILSDRISELEGALEFYSREKHCGSKGKRLMRSDCYVVEDDNIAQEALAKCNNKE